MPQGNKCPEPKIYQHATFQMSTGEHSVPDPFSLSLLEIWKTKDFIKFSKLSCWVYSLQGTLGLWVTKGLQWPYGHSGHSDFSYEWKMIHNVLQW